MSACGSDSDSSSEKDIESVESNEKTDEADPEEAEEETDVAEVAKVVADDEYLKATLVNIERKVEELFDSEKYVINLELENKASDKIVVQAHDVSIDGTMVDEMVIFSQDIAGDKNANGKMDIQNFDGDLPEMNDNIEFTLIVIDESTWGNLSEHEVKIEF